MENIIPFITSPTFSGFLLILKISFIVFALVCLAGIIYFVAKSSWLKYRLVQDLVEFFTYRAYGVRKIVKQWVKIKGRLETGLESEYKLAVIEADSLLDEILKRMGYGGETLGEKLKNITSVILPNLEQIWQAHKIRNNIIHDPDYRLNLDEAKRSIAIYEKALTDLDAL